MKVMKKISGILLSLMILTAFMPEAAFAAGGSVLSGNGTVADPYRITSEADLLLMVDLVNTGAGSGSYYIQTQDITVTAGNVEPMGSKANPFTGTFNGGNHKITGFKQCVSVAGIKYAGLFGYTDGATIKNVVMESVDISNTPDENATFTEAYVGGVVGYMKGGSLESCQVLSGSVSSTDDAGGIAGAIDSQELTTAGCRNGADVNGEVHAGGIVGSSRSSARPSTVTLVDVTNTGAISGGISGGIVGSGRYILDSTVVTKIEQSANSGAVTGYAGDAELYGDATAGGIGGGGVEVTGCRNTGTVQAPVAGGICGYTSNLTSNVFESVNSGTVNGVKTAAGINASTERTTKCYNTGRVSCSGESGTAYGIGVSAGFCYNTGKVTSENIAAGLAKGPAYSYNIGMVNGKNGSYASGIPGTIQTSTFCYYLENTGEGQTGATALTHEQLKSPESYHPDFGLDSSPPMWTMEGVEAYPYPELVSTTMTSEKLDAVENIEEAYAIRQAIAGLPETITLDDESTVNEIRQRYDGYVSQYVDDALPIGNIDVLTSAESDIADLRSAALETAKTEAKTALAGYANPDNYRDAQKTELAAAIETGNTAIDAAADVEAVATALENAKAAIDNIKTDKQLTKEEEAAKPKTKPEKRDLKAVKSLKVKGAKGKLTVKWKKATKKELKTFQGYEIQYTLNGTFTDYPAKKVSKKKASATLKKLLKKKKYTVRIRRYRDDGSVLHVSAWKIKKAKTK